MFDLSPKMLRTGRIVSALAAIAVAVGCGTALPPTSPVPSIALPSASAVATAASSPRPSTPAASPVLDRTASFRADVAAMLDARDTVHPDGWHGVPRADWIAAADAVVTKAATLTDDQLLVELVRLAAMPSWNGRDGHSGIFLTPGSGVHPYPIRFWKFSDGLLSRRRGRRTRISPDHGSRRSAGARSTRSFVSSSRWRRATTRRRSWPLRRAMPVSASSSPGSASSSVRDRRRSRSSAATARRAT